MVKVVDGREIAREIKERLRKKIGECVERGYRRPKLVNIWFEGSKESELFLRLKEKACTEVGIESKSICFPANVSEEEVIGRVENLNADDNIDGISIQAPLPKQISVDIFSKVDPDKDVEGLHPLNMGRLFAGEEKIIPCTPRAILTILERECVDLKGKEVVVVNHSIFIGKPLSILLLNRDATVSVCHIFTRKLEEFTRKADILVVATGKADLIGRNHIKDGAIIIDVGISKGDDRVKGDVRFEEVKEKASIITPVPGGVGPVTIACTLENLSKLYQDRVGSR